MTRTELARITALVITDVIAGDVSINVRLHAITNSGIVVFNVSSGDRQSKIYLHNPMALLREAQDDKARYAGKWVPRRRVHAFFTVGAPRTDDLIGDLLTYRDAHDCSFDALTR